MSAHIVCYVSISVLFLSLVSADPVAQFRHNRDGVQADRVKPLEGDLRDCDITPTPYLPPTVIETGERLTALRGVMADVTYNLAAYIIPTEDAHQSEYIAEHDKRRQYISGFSGSAGLAIVTSSEALLWTDGRYFLQADRQLDCNWQLMKTGQPGVPNPEEWLVENLANGDKVGVDPSLISINGYLTYEHAFLDELDKSIELKSIRENLVDMIWTDQPNYPQTELLILDAEKYTGETWQEKIWEFNEESIRGAMTLYGVQALVITKLDEVAWIFNLRGEDVPYNPMFISYAIITENSIRLAVSLKDVPNRIAVVKIQHTAATYKQEHYKNVTLQQIYMYDRTSRLTDDVRRHLGIGIGDSCENDETLSKFCVGVFEYNVFLDHLQALTEDRIWISTASSYAVYERVPQAKALLMDSPILLMKAVKSDQERKGMRNAHRKDSIALCELGAWLQKTVDTLEDPMHGDIDILSELIVEEKAREFRRMQPDFQMNSFHDIAGFGANAAVIHYISSEDTNVPIHKNGTFLYDSGSQYLDGSTDITRTFHFGEPTEFMKEAYTRVLLGHIDLAMMTLRTGINGGDVENIARETLWRNGLDYLHGSGHGIGHFLTIHEPPIYFGHYTWEQPFQIGVFISDEPGYYEDGEFGIRIENIMEVIEADTEHKFSNFTYMTFRMASLVPMEPKLIDFNLFSPRQFKWYNDYNQRIRDEIGPDLSTEAFKWMESKTGEIKYSMQITSSSVAMTTHIGLFICTILVRFVCQ